MHAQSWASHSLRSHLPTPVAWPTVRGTPWRLGLWSLPSLPPPFICNTATSAFLPQPGRPTTDTLDKHHDSNTTTALTSSSRSIAGAMLLLDYQNVLIQSVLTERFSG